MRGDLSLPVMLATGILPGFGARRAPVPLWHPGDLFDPMHPQGFWFDGSDNSVMWQDALGTTPVTELGQSVGLVLDKRLWGGKTYSQMLVDQPELALNPGGPFMSTDGWSPQDSNVTLSIDAGRLRLDFVGASSYSHTPIVTEAGKTYSVEVGFELGSNATLCGCSIRDQTNSGAVVIGAGANQSSASPIRFFFTAISELSVLRVEFTKTNPATAYVPRVSIKEVPGNHASQSTSASRPVWQENDLGARGLLCDGVNDDLVTPAIDFSSSDKVMMAAGVRKLSDVNIAILAELSATTNTNDGTFFFSTPISNGNPNYSYRSRGTVVQTAQYTDAAVAAPSSNVLVGLGDIAGDICRLRVDGDQVAENLNNQGSGNYGNYPLYIGRRGGASLPFSGFIHQLVIRGGAWPDAAELTQLETFIASKSGVNL